MIRHLATTWQFRHFWLSLVRLDLRNRYRRSALGLGWSLLHPIGMTVVLCIAFGGIFGDGNWMKYSAYLLCGSAVWSFVVGCATQGCDSFIRSEPYIRQCPLPMTIYPLRTVLGLLIHFAISLGIAVAAVLLFTWDLSTLWAVPRILPVVAMTTVLGWSLATLFGFTHLFFHDTKHLADVVFQLMFFLTPVMFSVTLFNVRGLGWMMRLNPMVYFLDLYRVILLPEDYQTNMVVGVGSVAELYLVCGTITGVALLLAAGAMAWLQRRVIFYL